MLMRNNNGIVIDQDVRKEFPALFASQAASHVSENYQMYRSDQLIDLMGEKGLKLVEIGQQASRKRNPNTQLHTMRFQPTTAPTIFGVNDSVPEVVIMNGHDGRNRFRALAGIFRFICSNGMVVADQEMGSVIRRHFGKNNTFDKVSAIVGELPEAINKMSGRILDWSALNLSENEQTLLASQLIKARGAPEWVEPSLVLEAKRDLEKPNAEGERNLWTTFNVLQENLTNSNLHSAREDNRTSLRPITGAWRNLKANEDLWTQAEAYFSAKVEGLTDEDKEALSRARKAAYERNRRAAKALVNAPEKEVIDA